MARLCEVVSTVQFKVYTGSSEAELEVMYKQKAASWCSGGLSWDSLFHSGVKQCDVTISPFGDTFLAIVPNGNQHGAVRPADCTLTEDAELSVQLIATGVAGAVLMAVAPLLSTSIVFRTSIGGTLTVLLCTLILSIFLLRCAPTSPCTCIHCIASPSPDAHRCTQPALNCVACVRLNAVHLFSVKTIQPSIADASCGPRRRFNQRGSSSSLLAAIAAMGASATGAYNFVFRFPDIPELLQNRWFLLYVAVAFFIGAAASYFFDRHDEKLLDILCVGLRIIGACMVFYSLSQLWELALAAVALLGVTVTWLLPRRHAALERLRLAAGGAQPMAKQRGHAVYARLLMPARCV
jgi:hypothetical protein